MKYLFLILVISALNASALFAQSRNKVIADSLLAHGMYDSALSFIVKSIKGSIDSTERSGLQLEQAGVLITQGKLDTAEKLLKEIKFFSTEEQAVYHNTVGRLFLSRGRFDVARQNFEKGAILIQSTANKMPAIYLTSLTGLASALLATGEYQQAEEYELAALRYKQNIYHEDSEEITASLNNLAIIYLTSDPAKALESYRKVLISYQRRYPVDHPKIAIANTNIGIAYSELKSFDEAIIHFNIALKIWMKIYPEGHPNVGLVLRNIGRAYAKSGDVNSAILFYENALKVYDNVYGDRHPEIASAYNEWGSSLLTQSQYDKALSIFQKSLIANAATFNNMGIDANPMLEDYLNPLVSVYTLGLKAKALERKYIEKSLRLQDIKQALSCIMSCDSLLDLVRNRSNDINDKLTLGKLADDVYQDGVRIAMLVSDNVLSAREYQQRAFYFSEKSKSAVLLASIAEMQAKTFAGIPDSLLEEEQRMKVNLAHLTQKMIQLSDARVKLEIRNQVFIATQEYKRFVQQLEAYYPEYYNLKYRVPAPNIQQIQKVLTDSTMVVSYFLAEKEKMLYIFLVSKNKFYVVTRQLPGDFGRQLKGFMNSIKFMEPEVFGKTSSTLSVLLLPNIPRTISEIVIIPSGKLSNVPFEALTLSNSKSNRFNEFKYLINRFSVSYVFSAGLLSTKTRNTDDRNDASILLCAPVQFKDKEGVETLAASAQEIHGIKKIFGENANAFLYEEATETLIKSKAPRSFKYLHLATHGFVDEEHPSLSKIFLSPTPQDDGALYAGEIYALSLNADLAVLSACDTGIGKFSKGEGIIGLSRALAYAGVKNSVVSYWSVADQSTAELMIKFYASLTKENSPRFNYALTSAKRQLASHEKYAAPYYWAPFVLIGR